MAWYTFFYGDQQNSPGTLLTFFEIPNAGAMRKGTNMIARIGLLVPNEAALDFFEARLQEKKRRTFQEALTWNNRHCILTIQIHCHMS